MQIIKSLQVIFTIPLFHKHIIVIDSSLLQSIPYFESHIYNIDISRVSVWKFMKIESTVQYFDDIISSVANGALRSTYLSANCLLRYLMLFSLRCQKFISDSCWFMAHLRTRCVFENLMKSWMVRLNVLLDLQAFTSTIYQITESLLSAS